MDATQTRPTPHEVLDALDFIASGDDISHTVIGALAEHGYVIVHPDDVRKGGGIPYHSGAHDLQVSYGAGWTDCRAHIFGDA